MGRRIRERRKLPVLLPAADGFQSAKPVSGGFFIFAGRAKRRIFSPVPDPPAIFFFHKAHFVI